MQFRALLKNILDWKVCEGVLRKFFGTFDDYWNELWQPALLNLCSFDKADATLVFSYTLEICQYVVKDELSTLRVDLVYDLDQNVNTVLILNEMMYTCNSHFVNYGIFFSLTAYILH